MNKAWSSAILDTAIWLVWTPLFSSKEIKTAFPIGFSRSPSAYGDKADIIRSPIIVIVLVTAASIIVFSSLGHNTIYTSSSSIEGGCSGGFGSFLFSSSPVWLSSACSVVDRHAPSSQRVCPFSSSDITFCATSSNAFDGTTARIDGLSGCFLARLISGFEFKSSWVNFGLLRVVEWATLGCVDFLLSTDFYIERPVEVQWDISSITDQMGLKH